MIDRYVLSLFLSCFFFNVALHDSVPLFHQSIKIRRSISLSRFDGRALLDFIRDSGSRPFRAHEKSEEEEELEEFVNFERYRDLIKHRRRGCRYFFLYFS